MTSGAEPRVLILETSGRIGWVAVAQGETLLAVQALDEARRHARDLAPAVVNLLHGAGWKPRDVNAVIVSRGPGSYTGLRVGIMSAKAFAYAGGSALLAVDTFHAIAAQAPSEVTRLEVIADAQQEKVYVQPFARPHAAAEMQPQSPLRIQPQSAWLAQRETAACVTGPALRLHEKRLLALGVQLLSPELWDAQPATLLRLGLARYAVGERDDVWSLEPLYLRPSSAEEKSKSRISHRSEA